jgi:hypothetical protein
MPRGDGTGPTGQGPTGGGRQGSVGGGRGQGRGLRRGGRGWRNWPVGIEQPLPVDAPHIEEMPAVPIAPVAAETEVALLRGQLQECQQAMAALNERILQLSENARERSAQQGHKQQDRAKESRDEETES